MTRVSTGATTVPEALSRLELVHDEIAYVEIDVRHLDRGVLGGAPDEIGSKLRLLGGRLWAAINHLAYVHEQILRAAGDWNASDAQALGHYLDVEHLPEGAGHFTFGEAVSDVAGGIVEFSVRWNALGAALGTWMADGGSLSDTYAREYAAMSSEVAPVRPVLAGGTEVALSVIFADAGLVAHYVEMPQDWQDRYDAAAVHLSSPEAKTVSATTATLIRETGGKAAGDIIGKGLDDALGKGAHSVLPKKVGEQAIDRFLNGTEDEQEAFARGMGDLAGAVADAQHGHADSLDRVVSAIRSGYYGVILRDAFDADPASVQHLIAPAAHVDAVVVHGTPADRDQPAYPTA